MYKEASQSRSSPSIGKADEYPLQWTPKQVRVSSCDVDQQLIPISLVHNLCRIVRRKRQTANNLLRSKLFFFLDLLRGNIEYLLLFPFRTHFPVEHTWFSIMSHNDCISEHKRRHFSLSVAPSVQRNKGIHLARAHAQCSSSVVRGIMPSLATIHCRRGIMVDNNEQASCFWKSMFLADGILDSQR